MTYTTTEIANYYGVPRSTVWRWIKRGELIANTNSKPIIITEEAFERFKQRNPKYDSVMNRISRLERLEQQKEELERQLKAIKEEIKNIEKTLNK